MTEYLLYLRLRQEPSHAVSAHHPSSAGRGQRDETGMETRMGKGAPGSDLPSLSRPHCGKTAALSKMNVFTSPGITLSACH